MTRARLIAAVGIVVVATTVTAARAAVTGIVRPNDERGKTPLALGSELFSANCITCHGIAGAGVPAGSPRVGSGDVRGLGPSLKGVGALSADFYLRTGYMPLLRPHMQPRRRHVQFAEHEIRALTTYVASLGAGPPVPRPMPARASLSEGQHVFTQNCAGCHQVVGQGGVVTGARVPPLDKATPAQIAEAVRIGPYVMPRFGPDQISDRQLDALVRYVRWTRRPQDTGGWGVGHLGPFPEGLVTWLLAAVVLVALCMVVGRRSSA